MMGVDVKPVVIAVNVSPNTTLPLIDTVPPKAATLVLNDADALAGEAKCVAVSSKRCVKVYCVFGVKLSNAGEV